MRYDAHTEAYKSDLQKAFIAVCDSQKALPKHNDDDPAKWLDQFEIQDRIITPGESEKYVYAHYISLKRIVKDSGGDAGSRIGFIYDWWAKENNYSERTAFWELVDDYLLPFCINQMARKFDEDNRK